MSENTTPHISLAKLLGILRCERLYQKGRSEAEECQLRKRIAKVPGISALRQIMEWPQETPTLEEALELESELKCDLAITIRNRLAPEWAGKPPEEMPLIEIVGVMDELWTIRFMRSPKGQAMIQKTAYQFTHIEEFFTDEQLRKMYQGFVADTIADLDKLPPIPQGDGDAKPEPAPAKGSAGTVPEDESAYVPASSLISEERGFPNLKAINKALKEHSQIRRKKPSKNRLLVHAGDWHKMLSQKAPGDPLDQDAATVDAVMKVEVAKNRIRGK